MGLNKYSINEMSLSSVAEVVKAITKSIDDKKAKKLAKILCGLMIAKDNEKSLHQITNYMMTSLADFNGVEYLVARNRIRPWIKELIKTDEMKEFIEYRKVTKEKRRKNEPAEYWKLNFDLLKKRIEQLLEQQNKLHAIENGTQILYELAQGPSPISKSYEGEQGFKDLLKDLEQTVMKNRNDGQNPRCFYWQFPEFGFYKMLGSWYEDFCSRLDKAEVSEVGIFKDLTEQKLEEAIKNKEILPLRRHHYRTAAIGSTKNDDRNGEYLRIGFPPFGILIYRTKVAFIYFDRKYAITIEDQHEKFVMAYNDYFASYFDKCAMLNGNKEVFVDPFLQKFLKN